MSFYVLKCCSSGERGRAKESQRVTESQRHAGHKIVQISYLVGREGACLVERLKAVETPCTGCYTPPVPPPPSKRSGCQVFQKCHHSLSGVPKVSTRITTALPRPISCAGVTGGGRWSNRRGAGFPLGAASLSILSDIPDEKAPFADALLSSRPGSSPFSTDIGGLGRRFGLGLGRRLLEWLNRSDGVTALGVGCG